MDARLLAIAASVQTQLAAKLSELDASRASVDQARRMGHEAAAPLVSPAREQIESLGNARAAAIMDAMADQAVTQVNAARADSIPQIVQVLEHAEAVTKGFSDDPAAGPQVDRVREAARRRATELAMAYLPAYRARLDGAAIDRATTEKLARAWLILGRVLTPKVAVFQTYADLTRDAALRVQTRVCGKAASDLGIPAASAALPMIVGNRVLTLGTFACILRDRGVRQGKLTVPPEGSEPPDYILRVFVPSGGAGGILETRNAADPAQLPGGQADLGSMFAFDSPATVAAAPNNDEILDAVLFTLRQVDIGVDRKALAVIKVGDDTRSESMSVAEWRQKTANLRPANTPADLPPDTCTAFAADPGKLSPAVAIRAVLACPAR